MIAPVSTLFNMLQIILLTLYGHIAALLDQRGYCLNILLKLTDNTHTGNILNFLFHAFHGNLLTLHFLQNTADTLHPALNLLNGTVDIIFLAFINNMVKFHFQLSHSQLIRA